MVIEATEKIRVVLFWFIICYVEILYGSKQSTPLYAEENGG